MTENEASSNPDIWQRLDTWWMTRPVYMITAAILLFAAIFVSSTAIFQIETTGGKAFCVIATVLVGGIPLNIPNRPAWNTILGYFMMLAGFFLFSLMMKMDLSQILYSSNIWTHPWTGRLIGFALGIAWMNKGFNYTSTAAAEYFSRSMPDSEKDAKSGDSA